MAFFLLLFFPFFLVFFLFFRPRYWSAIQTWYNFLITLLPFPQQQLSTDDFDGPIRNATNLAIKGVAAVAAYGYIVEKLL